MVRIFGDASGVQRAAAEAEGSLARLKVVAGEALGEAGVGGFGKLAGLAGVATAAAVGIGVLVHGVKDLVTAGLNAQVSQARLDIAMKNAHLSVKANSAAIDEYLAKQRQRGFSDNQVRDSLANTVRATHSVTEAMKLDNLAADVARTRNMDLASALSLVTRVYEGQTRGLARLGIAVPKVTTNMDALKASTQHATEEQKRQAQAADKLASTNEALTKTYQAFHGQADAFAKTDAGKIAAFGAQWDHVKETIGAKVLPVVAGALTEITKGVQWLAGEWEKYHKQIEETARRIWNAVKQNVIDNLMLVWHAIRNAFAIIVDIFKTVGALLTGNWSKVWAGLKNIVKDTLAGFGQLIVDAGKLLWDGAVTLGKTIGKGIVSGLGGLLDALVNAIESAISGAVSTVLGWIGLGGAISGGTPATPAQQRGLAASNPLLFGALGRSAVAPAASAAGGSAGGGPNFGGPSSGVRRSALAAAVGAPQQTLAGLGLAGAGAGGPSLGTVTAKAGKPAKKHGLDLRAAIAFAQSQLGKPYVYGAGHGPVSTYPSYDCSGFATQVASRVKGYAGGIATSQNAYRASSPASSKQDEPVLFGFRDWLSDGPGHMAIKLEGTVYSCGGQGGGVHQGVDPVFTRWMIPAGLEGIDVLDPAATGARALSASQTIANILRSPAGVAAVGGLGLTEATRLIRAGQLGDAPALIRRAQQGFLSTLAKLTGSAHVPGAGGTIPSAATTLAEEQARAGGEAGARARGETDPAKIQQAGEKALDEYQLKVLQDAAHAMQGKVNQKQTAWQRAVEKVQTILAKVPQKTVLNLARRKQTLKDAAAAAKQRDKLADELSGLMAQYADLQAQAALKGWDLGQLLLTMQPAAPAAGAPGTGTSSTATGPTAAETALSQALAASESWLSVIGGTAGRQIGAGGPNALSAATNMTFNVQTLTPGSPEMLQQLARTVLQAVSSQGSYVPASSGASGA